MFGLYFKIENVWWVRYFFDLECIVNFVDLYCRLLLIGKLRDLIFGGVLKKVFIFIIFVRRDKSIEK